MCLDFIERKRYAWLVFQNCKSSQLTVKKKIVFLTIVAGMKLCSHDITFSYVQT